MRGGFPSLLQFSKSQLRDVFVVINAGMLIAVVDVTVIEQKLANWILWTLDFGHDFGLWTLARLWTYHEAPSL